jgi:hypothetical protein
MASDEYREVREARRAAQGAKGRKARALRNRDLQRAEGGKAFDDRRLADRLGLPRPRD